MALDSILFGGICQLTAQYFEQLSDMSDLVSDRLSEIGRGGSDYVRWRDLAYSEEDAIRAARCEVARMMKETYLAFYADEIVERAKWD
mgnify:CR=1 FL=1